MPGAISEGAGPVDAGDLPCFRRPSILVPAEIWMMISRDSFGALSSLKIEGKEHRYYSLPALEKKGLGEVSRLPFSLRILLENLLRHEDGESVTAEDIKALLKWDPQARPSQEIAFSPARVVLQDFTGVPSVVDLAAMREAMSGLGGDSRKINPLVPSELVIDHSVQVDSFATATALQINVQREYERNREHPPSAQSRVVGLLPCEAPRAGIRSAGAARGVAYDSFSGCHRKIGRRAARVSSSLERRVW